MSQFVHIVYVHPVENGEPNLHKVKAEKEFEDKQEAKLWILAYNHEAHKVNDTCLKAVYYGCVNDETGELV
jgi:hypothetical protein